MSENIYKESHLTINIINLHNKIQKQIGNTLSTHGIGLSEYLILDQLYMAHGQKMKRRDLAENIGLSPSGITRLINPMEKIGLVEKEENARDARVSLVSLSNTGKQVYQDAQNSFDMASYTLFENFNTKQKSTFFNLLKIILK